MLRSARARVKVWRTRIEKRGERFENRKSKMLAWPVLRIRCSEGGGAKRKTTAAKNGLVLLRMFRGGSGVRRRRIAGGDLAGDGVIGAVGRDIDALASLELIGGDGLAVEGDLCGGEDFVGLGGGVFFAGGLDGDGTGGDRFNDRVVMGDGAGFCFWPLGGARNAQGKQKDDGENEAGHSKYLDSIRGGRVNVIAERQMVVERAWTVAG